MKLVYNYKNNTPHIELHKLQDGCLCIIDDDMFVLGRIKDDKRQCFNLETNDISEYSLNMLISASNIFPEASVDVGSTLASILRKH